MNLDMKAMMKQAQKMQQKMMEAQAELADKTVTATAGGGKVTVVANGAGDVVSIKIDKAVVDPEDVEMLEDLILTGVKKAIEEAKALGQAEMGKVTGGMGLPPGLGF
jgi:DNA-binding YbaB/EbfC family protein